jgi:hypothetical protein
MRRAEGLAAILLLLSGCPSDDTSSGDDAISPDDRLLDPKTCEECHPQHYREWLGSMHAYAAEDPVFRAMNARGQRETNGALGDFCIKCHAPMAVELGLTTDGLNLDEVPKHLQGVTCFFCHTTEAVEGTHNNPLVLSGKRVLFGSITDPVENDVHASAYSALLDSRTVESARACGSCHDIVTDAGVHLERTFAEWQESFFSDIDPLSGELAIYGQSCATCHFGRGIEGPIADFPGVRADRKRHDHSLVGVDVALTDFPDATLGPELRAEQLARIEEQRKSALCATICVNPDGMGGSDVDVWLHNEFSAHGWPSGANQDRRAWLEMHAFAGADEMLVTGVVPPGTPVTELDDPLLWLFRDRIFDAAGNEVHMFWEAASYESAQLPASAELSPMGDLSTWRARRFNVGGAEVDRVTTVVHIRPMGLDVLDELVESGDLDPAIRDAMPLFDVAPTVLEWTPDVAETFDGYGPCVSSSDVCGAPIVGAAPPEG